MRKAWDQFKTAVSVAGLTAVAVLTASIVYHWHMPGSETGADFVWVFFAISLVFAVCASVVTGCYPSVFWFTGAAVAFGVAALAVMTLLWWDTAGLAGIRGWLLFHLGAPAFVLTAGLLYGFTRIGKPDNPD